MENKNIRLVILLVIFSTLAILQMYFFTYSAYPLLKYLVILLNSCAIFFYAKAITDNLHKK